MEPLKGVLCFFVDSTKKPSRLCGVRLGQFGNLRKESDKVVHGRSAPHHHHPPPHPHPPPPLVGCRAPRWQLATHFHGVFGRIMKTIDPAP